MAADDFDQFAGFPAYLSADDDDERDNGFADPADVDLAEVAEAPVVELTFEEKFDRLGTAVTRHPLYREILYKVLGFCVEERLLRDVEEEIATYPEFPSASQNQYFLINILVKAGGLDFIERDDGGRRVLPEDKEGLTEDEIDDLVATYHYRTNDVGLAFLKEYSPTSRLVDLLTLAPERTQTYIDVLEFVRGGTRKMSEIEDLLKDREIGTMVNGRFELIKPSVFVDKLEHAGVLVWDSGWKLSKEGEEYLDEMK